MMLKSFPVELKHLHLPCPIDEDGSILTVQIDDEVWHNVPAVIGADGRIPPFEEAGGEAPDYPFQPRAVPSPQDLLKFGNRALNGVVELGLVDGENVVQHQEVPDEVLRVENILEIINRIDAVLKSRNGTMYPVDGEDPCFVAATLICLAKLYRLLYAQVSGYVVDVFSMLGLL